MRVLLTEEEKKKRQRDRYKKWYENNKEKLKPKNKIWRANNRKRIREYAREWRLNNKDHYDIWRENWRFDNKEHIKAYDKKNFKRWRLRNKEKINAHIAQYKCKRIYATCKTSVKVKREMFYLIASEIFLETGIDHDVDHIIPISKGGLNHEDFLMITTASYNRRKGAKIDYPLPKMQYLILDDFVQLYLEEVI